MSRLFQQLESRRLMAADADVVLDIWPGPMHSDPSEVGRYLADDGSLTFKANTPEGEQWFKTDGTPDGTVPYTPPETIPPTIEHTYTRISETELLQEVDYSDATGREFHWQSVEYCLEGDTTDTCMQRILTELAIIEPAGDSMLVMERWALVEETYYLADGSQDMWLEVDTSRGFNRWFTVGDDVFIEATDQSGAKLLLGVTVPFEQVVDNYTATDSEIYINRGTEIGRLTLDTGYFLMDIGALEFPTQFVAFGGETDEGVLVLLWDPVYETTLWHVHDDSTSQRLAIDRPATDLNPIGKIGDYYLVMNDEDAIWALYGDDLFETALRRGSTGSGRYWAVGSDAMLWQEMADFETGRELTVRHLMAGDVNLDGYFDSADLIELMARGQYEDDIAGNSHWLTGDFDGDGEFGTSDLITALAEGTYRS